jgi:hypothetical protein
MTDDEVINNGDMSAALPPALAELLVEHRGWKKGEGRKRGRRSAPADEPPIPMTRIPGVVDVSMRQIKKLVADGTVPFTLDGRTKMVKPADVRAALTK